MSALGHKQTFAAQNVLFALPPKADIWQRETHVRFGPERASAVRGYALEKLDQLNG
jgi:hypothetical protein